MGQAKNRGTHSERVQQAIARTPKNSMILGVKEDFDIPEWNAALNRYVHFCSLYGENKIPFEANNSIRFGDYVIQFDPDATGYFDKDKAYVCHYSKATGYGKVTDLMQEMIWDMDQPTLLSPDAQQPVFLECVDSKGKTAIQRAGWTPNDLKLDSELVSMLSKLAKQKEPA
jgi:hypothetical protein